MYGMLLLADRRLSEPVRPMISSVSSKDNRCARVPCENANEPKLIQEPPGRSNALTRAAKLAKSSLTISDKPWRHDCIEGLWCEWRAQCICRHDVESGPHWLGRAQTAQYRVVGKASRRDGKFVEFQAQRHASRSRATKSSSGLEIHRDGKPWRTLHMHIVRKPTRPRSQHKCAAPACVVLCDGANKRKRSIVLRSSPSPVAMQIDIVVGQSLISWQPGPQARCVS